jgi:hypothetical protein
MPKKYILFFAAIILILATADRADAYLDLGTGSYIAQALIGTTVTGLFFLISFGRKLKKRAMDFFKKNGDGH